MTVLPQVQRAYDRTRPHAEVARKRVRERLSTWCLENGYLFIDRLKDVASISEKVETGRFRGWSDIDDVYGASIITPTLEEEPHVIAYLQEAFECLRVLGRERSKKDPQVFRFDEPRLLVRLRDLPADAAPELKQFQFELQVKTVFEHAWSVATHGTVYKADAIDWRRMRLAAQLRAAVEQLDLFIMGFDGVAGLVSPAVWPETDQKKRMSEALRALSVPGELAPAAWSRFVDSMHSVILAECRRRGLRPADFDAVISRALDTVGQYFRLTLPDRIPRSLTLFQLCFGVLAAEGFLRPELPDFVAPVNGELEGAFPVCRGFKTRFRFPGP